MSTRSERLLHLVVPELFSEYAIVTPAPRLNALETLLSRAHISEWASPKLMPTLLTLFDLPTHGELPIASLTYLGDTQDNGNPKIWLRADPVHLYAHHDRVLLFDISSMSTLTPAEADGLLNDLNAFYREDGLYFLAPTPTRWYLAIPTLPQLTTTPLPDVLGKDIYDYLPSGTDHLIWRQRLNEIQMLLSRNPINLTREAQGQFPINSLWFWGLGQLPSPPSRRWTHVWSHDPLAQGLACLTQTPHTPAPEIATTWLTQLPVGEHLVILSAPALTEIEHWSAWINHLESTWFAPLLNALTARHLSSIILYPCDNQTFYLTSARARHWWRRRRRWDAFIPSP
jgi:hypothetical protein